MQDLTIAAIQAPLEWKNPEINLRNFDHRIDQIFTYVDLIILPEAFTTGFSVTSTDTYDEVPGITLPWMMKKAAERDAVITGSFIVKENEKLYNRLIWMNPDGSYYTYNKRHLFRMAGEHLHFTPGEESLTVNLKGWNIQPHICYDLRFPCWSRNSYENGHYEYDLLIYVANWPAARALPWNTLLHARAIENMAYCIGVNRVGKDGMGIDHIGNTQIVDFMGNVISSASEYVDETILTTLPMDALIEYRKKFNVGLDWD